MGMLEISTGRDSARRYVVIIRDRDMRELARMEALSAGHARSMATDCALVAVRTSGAAVVLV
ncbi:MAG: hypothetical protein K2Y29_08395 [Beijerinckiaceae bacterium]|nr:hypothetical protein [Beijerinckiaceae bacterium]